MRQNNRDLSRGKLCNNALKVFFFPKDTANKKELGVVAFWPKVWTSQCLGIPGFRLVLLKIFRTFKIVSTDVKPIISWIKDDNKEYVSCSESSSLGFGSIYLSATDPSFFQPLLKLSPHALDCSLSMAYLKKFCLPSPFSDQREHYQFTKHPRFFLSPSTSVSLRFPAGSRDWDPGWEHWIPLNEAGNGGLLHRELENHAWVCYSQQKLLSLIVQTTKHFW